MQCRHCSLTIPEDSAFCPECGRTIETRVPVSATPGRAAVGAEGKLPDSRRAEPPRAAEELRTETTPWAAMSSPPSSAPALSPKRSSNKGWLVLVGVVLLAGAIAMIAWLVSGDESGGGDGVDGELIGGGYQLITDFETSEAARTTFNATAGDVIVVQAFPAEEGADPVVHLWGPDGAYWVNDDFGGMVDSYLEVNANTTGTYEVLVAPFDEADPRLMYLIVELNP